MNDDTRLLKILIETHIVQLKFILFALSVIGGFLGLILIVILKILNAIETF